MSGLQLAVALAQESGGAGFGAGMGAGIGAGIAIGMGASFGGSGHLKKRKLQNEVAAAIEAGEISILDQNGESVTAEALFNR